MSQRPCIGPRRGFYGNNAWYGSLQLKFEKLWRMMGFKGFTCVWDSSGLGLTCLLPGLPELVATRRNQY
jgi:hypothetical protein